MPRFIPPHLMALICLLIFVLWLMLVHQFRRSRSMQRFVGEILGDDSPEQALLTYEAAKQRLESHLNNPNLDPALRQQMETALGATQATRYDADVIEHSA